MWLYLKGRVGGFTDEDVDKLITDPEKSFTIFEANRSADLYNELRRMPDSIIRRVRFSLVWLGLT